MGNLFISKRSILKHIFTAEHYQISLKSQNFGPGGRTKYLKNPYLRTRRDPPLGVQDRTEFSRSTFGRTLMNVIDGSQGFFIGGKNPTKCRKISVFIRYYTVYSVTIKVDII